MWFTPVEKHSSPLETFVPSPECTPKNNRLSVTNQECPGWKYTATTSNKQKQLINTHLQLKSMGYVLQFGEIAHKRGHYHYHHIFNFHKETDQIKRQLDYYYPIHARSIISVHSIRVNQSPRHWDDSHCTSQATMCRISWFQSKDLQGTQSWAAWS